MNVTKKISLALQVNLHVMDTDLDEAAAFIWRLNEAINRRCIKRSNMYIRIEKLRTASDCVSMCVCIKS